MFLLIRNEIVTKSQYQRELLFRIQSLQLSTEWCYRQFQSWRKIRSSSLFSNLLILKYSFWVFINWKEALSMTTFLADKTFSGQIFSNTSKYSMMLSHAVAVNSIDRAYLRSRNWFVSKESSVMVSLSAKDSSNLQNNAECECSKASKCFSTLIK